MLPECMILAFFPKWYLYSKVHQLVASGHYPFLIHLDGQDVLAAQFSFLVFLTWFSRLPELWHMMSGLLDLYLNKSTNPHLLSSHIASPGLWCALA